MAMVGKTVLLDQSGLTHFAPRQEKRSFRVIHAQEGLETSGLLDTHDLLHKQERGRNNRWAHFHYMSIQMKTATQKLAIADENVHILHIAVRVEHLTQVDSELVVAEGQELLPSGTECAVHVLNAAGEVYKHVVLIYDERGNEKPRFCAFIVFSLISESHDDGTKRERLFACDGFQEVLVIGRQRKHRSQQFAVVHVVLLLSHGGNDQTRHFLKGIGCFTHGRRVQKHQKRIRGDDHGPTERYESFINRESTHGRNKEWIQIQFVSVFILHQKMLIHPHKSCTSVRLSLEAGATT